jgi:hypothetical protein
MADRLDNLQLDNLAGQQTQRPIGITFGRRAKPHGDHLSLLLAAQNLLRGRLLTRLAVQRLLEALGHEALAQHLHRAGATVERLGDLLVGPRRPHHVRLQEHLRPPHLLARSVELLDKLTQRPAFLRRQPHNILLVHETPPCYRKSPKLSANRQP